MSYEDVGLVFTSNLNYKDFKQIQPKIEELIEKNFKDIDIKGFFKSETHLHTNNVANIATDIAEELNFSKEDRYKIRAIAPFHDFGKLAIDKHILNKPGKLTVEEFKKIQEHSEIGYRILMQFGDNEILNLAALIAREHHEKYNGRGYPHGRKKEDIHLFSRIVAAADVFDSLTAERCYKQGWSKDRIYELFKAEKGKHFDPEIAEIVLKKIL